MYGVLKSRDGIQTERGWNRKYYMEPAVIMYGDSADNTVDENSSVFSLIRMHWLLSARACGQ